MTLYLITLSFGIFFTSECSLLSGVEISSNNWVTKRINKRQSDSNINWALDRLNQKSKQRDSNIANVAVGDVYVVGSGVRATHTEFGDRILEGYSFDNSDSREDCGSDSTSTGAASIVLGENIGISQDANIYPVKIGCGGLFSGASLSKGLQWVQRQIASNSPHRAVILITFGITNPVSELNTLAAEHLVVVPAGDNARDECSSLKSLDEIGIMVVASSTSTDTQSTSSNYGSCVDIWAPGEEVPVASSTDDTDVRTDSGTVFAAAAVAGVAIQNVINIKEVGDVMVLKAVMLGHSTKGALELSASARSSNTPNSLLFDICPYYKLPDQGKCYVAQTKQLVNVENDNIKMTRAAKSVVTFDYMSYNYYEDCFSVLVFASSETSSRIEATHDREGTEIKQAVFTISTKNHVITLSSGPSVSIDGQEDDLSQIYVSGDSDDFFHITKDDVEIQTQNDADRFIPIVTVSLPDNVTVSFDGHQEIRVKIDVEIFKEKTKGICGYFDNSHVKEFVDRDGNDMEFTFAKNKKKFVREWETDSSVCDDPPDVVCDTSGCQQTAENVCYPLKDVTGEFNQCFEKLDPSTWYTNCVDAVTECCCAESDVGECACEEQKKYWWASILEGCTTTVPCDTPCKKPETDKECTDDAGSEVDFFYREEILYAPKDNCHYVDDHESIECRHNGSWDRQPSDCKIKTCDTPGLTTFVEFVSTSKEEYNCGEEVDYTCTKTSCDCNCYQMSGASRTQCVSSGERTADWNNAPPTCSLNHCVKPTAPNVDKLINVDGSELSWVVDKDTMDTSCCSGRARFACHECYELQGDEELRCCNDRWGNGTLPQCKLKMCNDPNIELDAQNDPHLVVTATDRFCSHSVTYSCDNTCYEIEGSVTRTCQPDGSWSGELPRCVKKRCPELDSYDNGVYLFDGDELAPDAILECGDSVGVKCESCHWPCSSTCDRTCKWNGTDVIWSNEEPMCRPFECRQRVIANATVFNKRGPLECGESSEATCNTCFKQVGGSNTRTCTEPQSNETCPISDVDGFYDGTEITCVEMFCPELVVGPNLVIKSKICTNDFDCDCEVTFECSSDCYALDGESTLRCDGSGWDYPVPTCRRKTCPFPDPDFSRHYNYDREWQGGCQFERDGSRVDRNDVLYCGDIIDVEAADKQCYHVCNKDRLRCDETGNWNLTERYYPSCMYMECEAPAPVPNAHLVYNPGEYNCTTTLRYECDTCYRHVGGDLTRDCVAKDIKKSPDGKWSGDAPVCQKMECDGSHPDVGNATVIGDNYLCGEKVTYQCNECSTLVGNSELICDHPDISKTVASWINNTPPTCQPICCPPLLPTNSNEDDYQVVATDARYIYGPHPMHDICGDNYVCQQIEAKCEECYEYKTTDGFEEFAPTRTCKNYTNAENVLQGWWDNTDKICTRKECLKRDIEISSHAHYKTQRMGDVNKCNQTIELECNCCYKLNDESITETHQCLPSKLWDKVLPTCVPITCETPEEIENGNYTAHGSSSSCSCGTVRYECNPCFRLVGEATLSCIQDKNMPTARWSSAPPVCEPICCEPLSEPVDPITNLITTKLTHRNSPRSIKFSKEEMSVKENFETCEKDYVCQNIDPECGTCFEYTDDDANNVDGVSQPPQRSCVKRKIEGQWKGEWTNKDKYCTLKKCPYRDLEDDKHIHYSIPSDYNSDTVSHCLSNITVECDGCYELSDGSHSVSHICLENKAWSKDIPTCHRTECPTPPVIDHCTYKTGDNLCDFKRELKCDECYYDSTCTDKSITDVMKVQCNADKSWSWVTQLPSLLLKSCPPAPEIDNGQVDVTGTDCGDMARYACDRCYKFSHDSDCLCERRKCIPDASDCTRGMWNETAPQCEKIVCPNLPPGPQNGTIVHVDNTCDGSVRYECDVGYYLTDGDLVRNCTESGTWSGKHPVCTIKRCTAIEESPNRQHSTEENAYGTVVTFKCDSCYEFNAKFIDEDVKEVETIFPRFHILKCGENGNWNGSEPVCREKSCGNPGVPANTRFSNNTELSFQCGDTVSYKCNEGYVFEDGSSWSRSCNGETWSGTAPRCVPVDCGEVDVPPPMFVEHDISTTYQNEVKYYCGTTTNDQRCYEDFDPDNSTCLANGLWDTRTAPMECKRLQCKDVPAIENGELSKIYQSRLELMKDNDCGQKYKLKCDEGYDIEGYGYVKCVTVNWIPSTLPTCVKKTCTPQDNPAHGQVTPSYNSQSVNQVYFGDTLSYSCDECYERSGARIRQCVTDGDGGVTWSPLEPECNPITCFPEQIANGRVYHYNIGSPVRCGTTVSFRCDYGFDLVGSEDATCLDTGTWDTIFPRCEEIRCQVPAYREHMITETHNITDASETGTIYLPDTVVVYECEENYDIEGVDEIYCQDNGRWSSEPPTCQARKCDEDELKQITDLGENGHIAKLDEMTREIRCGDCYRATNTDTLLTCEDGRWSPPKPAACVQILCGIPGQPENGLLVDMKGKYNCGSTATFECEDGYRLSGASTTTCKEDGHWDNPIPNCLEKNCAELEEVANAITTVLRNGQEVHYECLEGYELYGETVRRCYNGSQWSGPGPTRCKVKHCGNVGDILFGTVELTNAGLEGGDDTFGAEVKYTCIDDRYQLIGEDSRDCTANKQWSYEPPQCKCVSCSILSILNGRVETGDENKVGTSIQYICDLGYKLVPEGSNTRTCLQSGVWDGVQSQCERIKCKRPRIPDGGLFVGTPKSEYNYLETVQVICEPWQNKLVYRCESEGLWEGDIDKECSSCKEVQRKITKVVTKVIAPSCNFGKCTKQKIIRVPVTSYVTEVVCD